MKKNASLERFAGEWDTPGEPGEGPRGGGGARGGPRSYRRAHAAPLARHLYAIPLRTALNREFPDGGTCAAAKRLVGKRTTVDPVSLPSSVNGVVRQQPCRGKRSALAAVATNRMTSLKVVLALVAKLGKPPPSG
jgi:hypothetical protein